MRLGLTLARFGQLGGLTQVLVLGGCEAALTVPADSAISVSISSDQTTYAAGSTATIAVRNDDRESFIYGGLCGSVLEISDYGAWRAVAESSPPCPGLAIILAPGETRSFSTQLSTVGYVRLRLVFQRYPGSGAVEDLYQRSNPFHVTR